MPKASHPAPVARTTRDIVIVDRPASVQSQIVIGNLALKRSDPRFIPLMVANQVLGGSAASRLFMDLREQRSLTYGAYSRPARPSTSDLRATPPFARRSRTMRSSRSSSTSTGSSRKRPRSTSLPPRIASWPTPSRSRSRPPAASPSSSRISGCTASPTIIGTRSVPASARSRAPKRSPPHSSRSTLNRLWSWWSVAPRTSHQASEDGTVASRRRRPSLTGRVPAGPQIKPYAPEKNGGGLSPYPAHALRPNSRTSIRRGNVRLRRTSSARGPTSVSRARWIFWRKKRPFQSPGPCECIAGVNLDHGVLPFSRGALALRVGSA